MDALHETFKRPKRAFDRAGAHQISDGLVLYRPRHERGLTRGGAKQMDDGAYGEDAR